MHESYAPGPGLGPGDEAGMDDVLAEQLNADSNLGQHTVKDATFFRDLTQVKIFCHPGFIIDGGSKNQSIGIDFTFPLFLMQLLRNFGLFYSFSTENTFFVLFKIISLFVNKHLFFQTCSLLA